MRICTEKATGKLLEAQSGGTTQAHLDTLVSNAVQSGRPADSVEVRYVGYEEYLAMVDAIMRKPTLQEKRMKEFARVSLEDRLEALWEKVMEGNSTAADAIQQKREDVKSKIK